MPSVTIPVRLKQPQPIEDTDDDFLVVDDQDGILVIGIDFGTTYVPLPPSCEAMKCASLMPRSNITAFLE